MKNYMSFTGAISLKYISVSFPLVKLRIFDSKIQFVIFFLYKIDLENTEIDNISIENSFFFKSIRISHHNNKFNNPIKFFPFPKSIDEVLTCLNENLLVKP